MPLFEHPKYLQYLKNVYERNACEITRESYTYSNSIL